MAIPNPSHPSKDPIKPKQTPSSQPQSNADDIGIETGDGDSLAEFTESILSSFTEEDFNCVKPTFKPRNVMNQNTKYESKLNQETEHMILSFSDDELSCLREPLKGNVSNDKHIKTSASNRVQNITNRKELKQSEVCDRQHDDKATNATQITQSKLTSEQMFIPNPEQDIIDISCGICGCKLYQSLQPNEKPDLFSEALQCGIGTNIAPIEQNISPHVTFADEVGAFICRNNCHNSWPMLLLARDKDHSLEGAVKCTWESS
eukprot:787150_1